MLRENPSTLLTSKLASPGKINTHKEFKFIKLSAQLGFPVSQGFSRMQRNITNQKVTYSIQTSMNIDS